MFGELLTTDELAKATGGGAWVRAMLDAEAALAAASAERGVVPAEAAAEIGEKGLALNVDPVALGRAARAGGNPVIPLVVALRRQLSPAAADWVHFGATSQDILDSAAVLVAHRAGRLVDAHLATLADGCAALAEGHRHTLVTARTLLQPALPTTFGAKAAGWLVGALTARRQLDEALRRLPASLGGAAGALAAFGEEGPAVLAAFARRLCLPEPLVPWHTARQPIAALGAALATVAATAAKTPATSLCSCRPRWPRQPNLSPADPPPSHRSTTRSLPPSPPPRPAARPPLQGCSSQRWSPSMSVRSGRGTPSGRH